VTHSPTQRTQSHGKGRVGPCACGRLKTRAAQRCQRCFADEMTIRGRVSRQGREMAVGMARTTDQLVAYGTWREYGT